MRKEMKLQYSDKIITLIDAGGRFKDAAQKRRESIMSETLSKEITICSLDSGTMWDIDGEKVRILISRA